MPVADEVCERCGQRHETPYRNQRPCAGHVKLSDDNGEPLWEPDGSRAVRACRRAASTGLPVCVMHGGGSPEGRAKSAAAKQERKAANVMRRFGTPIDTTPTEALLDAVKWTAGYVAWLREKVGPVDGDNLTDEAALTQLSTHTGKRETGVWVDLLGQWHDRLEKICVSAIRAGVEERRVRIAEQQGALVADVIRKILDDLNLTAEQAAAAGDAVPRHLRALAS